MIPYHCCIHVVGHLLCYTNALYWWGNTAIGIPIYIRSNFLHEQLRVSHAHQPDWVRGRKSD
jgi:uncharacterized membrane protein YwzB